MHGNQFWKRLQRPAIFAWIALGLCCALAFRGKLTPDLSALVALLAGLIQSRRKH